MPEQQQEQQHRIVLVRHAKSAWPDGVDDHERPLAPRGLRAAPLAGRRLAGHGWTPDLALVSTAERALRTWQLMAAELPAPPEAVHDGRLYGLDTGEQLIALLAALPDPVATVLVLGHNPVLHEAADALAGEADDPAQAARLRERFPTAAVAVLAFTGPWQRLRPGTARLVDHWTPKGG
ncbi:SixA phosphatase family protein [Kitasatospora sp. NPDC001309]|uniref:SixA phosphatase family protein n=1 Tax=Kitasatospora sp. NPDC001309 TaxID=3364013 RepID=UPI00369195F0